MISWAVIVVRFCLLFSFWNAFDVLETYKLSSTSEDFVKKEL